MAVLSEVRPHHVLSGSGEQVWAAGTALRRLRLRCPQQCCSLRHRGTLGSQFNCRASVRSRFGAAFPVLTNRNKALTHGRLEEAGGVGCWRPQAWTESQPAVRPSSASPCCVAQGRPLALSEAWARGSLGPPGREATGRVPGPGPTCLEGEGLGSFPPYEVECHSWLCWEHWGDPGRPRTLSPVQGLHTFSQAASSS